MTRSAPMFCAAVALVAALLATPAQAIENFPVWAFPVVIVGGVALVGLAVVAIMYCSNSCDDVDIAAVERANKAGEPDDRYPQVMSSRRGSFASSRSHSHRGDDDSDGGSEYSDSDNRSNASSARGSYRSSRSFRSEASSRGGYYQNHY